MDIEREYFYLNVPQETAWDPHKALSLTDQLLTAGDGCCLQILATSTTLQWRLGIPVEKVDSVLALFRSFYPDIRFEDEAYLEDKEGADHTYWWWIYELKHPDVLPIQKITSSEVRAFDPLINIGAAMSTLRGDEVALYTLELFIATHETRAKMEKIFKDNFTIGFGRKVLGFTLMIFGNAMVQKGTGHYVPPPQKSADDLADEKIFLEDKAASRAKLELPLIEVEMTYQVMYMPDEDRRREIKKAFFNGTNRMDGDPQTLVIQNNKNGKMVLTSEELACLWHLPHGKMNLENIVWAKKLAKMPQVLVGKKEGICLGTGTHSLGTSPVYLEYPDRASHVNIVGKSGMGKSTLLVNMINQDIKNGHGVSVIDPHGDLVADTLASLPEGREKDVILVDVMDKDFPFAFNLLSPQPGLETYEVADQAIGVVKTLFEGNWYGGQMEDVMYAVLSSLLYQPNATLLDVTRMLLNPGFRNQVLSKVKDPIALEFWRDDFGNRSEREQQKMSQPIQNRIRKFLRNPILRRMLGQPQSLNIRQVMDRKKILLVSLGGLGQIEKNTLGSLIVSKFQMSAMSRASLDKEQRIPHYLYIDEVQNFVNTSLDVIFSEARKYNLSLVVANQFLNQLDGKVLQAVLGNIGASMIFQVGANDKSTLGPYVKPGFTPDDLLTLDKYTTATWIQHKGNTLPAFSMETNPPPEKRDDHEEIEEEIRSRSREKYARSAEEVDKEIASLYQQPVPDAFLEAFDNDEEPDDNAGNDDNDDLPDDDDLSEYGDKKQ